jgi:hypothetical protein
MSTILSADRYNYTAMTPAELTALRHVMQVRLMAAQHPDRAPGVRPEFLPIYEAICQRASAELRRRETGEDS